MIKFLIRTVRYPGHAAEKHIQGKVILKLLVERDGTISDIKVIKSVDEYLDKEAIRVLRAAPKFTPGSVNGKPVRSYCEFPLSFTLAN